MKRSFILRSLALAMGVASAVISILGTSGSNVSFLLGMGLACLAMDALSEKKR